MKWYYIAGFALAGIILLPAVVAGGGFILAGLVVLLLLLVLLGGPKAWELHLNRSMGERGRTDVRDLIQGGGGDKPGDRNRGER